MVLEKLFFSSEKHIHKKFKGENLYSYSKTNENNNKNKNVNENFNGNDNNLTIESLDFSSIDNDLISFTMQKRNAYITAERAIERYKVKITATTPKLFGNNEIKNLK